MGILDVVTKYSKTAKKAKRKQKRLDVAQSEGQINQAQFAKEQFIEDSQRQRLQLNESLAKRGMAGGTYADESRKLFENARARALSNLESNEQVARLGGDAMRYGYTVQRRMRPINMINDILDLAKTGVAIASGAGAFGAAGAAGAGVEGMSFGYDD